MKKQQQWRSRARQQAPILQGGDDALKEYFSEKKRTKKGIKNKYRASINERRETSFYVARLFRDLESTTYLSFSGFPQLRHSFEQAWHDFSPFGQRHLRPDNYNDVRNLLCKRFLKSARRQPELETPTPLYGKIHLKFPFWLLEHLPKGRPQ